jgi:hypothetical protein
MLTILFLALAAGLGWLISYFRGYRHGTVDTRERIRAIGLQIKAEQEAAYARGAEDAAREITAEAQSLMEEHAAACLPLP